MIVQKEINTYKVSWLNHCEGGKIREFYVPETKDELIDLIRSFQVRKVSYIVVGHTSNIYFSPNFSCDICITTRKVKNCNLFDNYVVCDCGVTVSSFSSAMVDKGYVGFEGLIDLPGTVAGAVYGNSSCFACSINDLVEEVEILDDDGVIKYISREELGMSERSTVFKRGRGG